MKGTILAHSVNQLLTCGLEEVQLLDGHLILEFEIFWKVIFKTPTFILKIFSLIAARAELGEFVEYDLDNEDVDWLSEFNKDRKILTPEM